jgi:hypothetical protein
MYTGRTLAGTACALLVAAGPVFAQLGPVGGQPGGGGVGGGQTGGLFGRQATRDVSGTSQNLSILVSGSTGADRNRDSEGRPLPPVTFGAQQSGTISSVDGTLTYALNRGFSSITSTARGYANYGTEGVGRIAGGSGSLQGTIAFSGRSGLVVDTSASYDPGILFDAFGLVAEQIDTGAVPGANPTQGVSEGRWLSYAATGGVYRSWTSRQRTVVAGTFAHRQAQQQGGGLDNTVGGGSVRHTWAARAGKTLDFGYRIDGQEQMTATGVATVYTQAGDAMFTFDRRVSATRRVSVSLGSGLVFVRTPSDVTRTDISFVVPSFSALARINLFRRWELALDGRRDITVLRGLSPLVFRSDAAALRLGGNPVDRVQLQFSIGASRGSSESTDAGSFDMTTAVAQAQFAVSRYAAVSTSVNYYLHRLRDLTLVDPRFPAAFRRSSVRVGVTLWLPVIGR